MHFQWCWFIGMELVPIGIFLVGGMGLGLGLACLSLVALHRLNSFKTIPVHVSLAS